MNSRPKTMMPSFKFIQNKCHNLQTLPMLRALVTQKLLCARSSRPCYTYSPLRFSDNTLCPSTQSCELFSETQTPQYILAKKYRIFNGNRKCENLTKKEIGL